MKNIISVLMVLFFCSCTYYDMSDLQAAKVETELKCESEEAFEGNVSLIETCKKGVGFFSQAGIVSAASSGDENRIRSQIKQVRKKASGLCDSNYGDNDPYLIACDKGVELAAIKAHELYLTSNLLGEKKTSEFAVNDNPSNDNFMSNNEAFDHEAGHQATSI